MEDAARDVVLIVENPVVLVGDLVSDKIGILGGIHEHQVLRRVVKISAVVHVDVIAA